VKDQFAREKLEALEQRVERFEFNVNGLFQKCAICKREAPKAESGWKHVNAANAPAYWPESRPVCPSCLKSLAEAPNEAPSATETNEQVAGVRVLS